MKNADSPFIVLANFQKQRISRCVNWTMADLDCFAKILAKRLNQKVHVQVINRFKGLDLVQVVQVEPTLLNPLTLVGKYQAKHIGIASLFWSLKIEFHPKNRCLGLFTGFSLTINEQIFKIVKKRIPAKCMLL